MKPCKTPVTFSLTYAHLQKQRETTQKVEIVISPLRSRLESVIPQITCICVSLLATGRILVSLLHPHLIFHFYFPTKLTPLIFHFHVLIFFFFNAIADFPDMDVVHMQKREFPRRGEAQENEEEMHSLEILPLGSSPGSPQTRWLGGSPLHIITDEGHEVSVS